MRASDLNPGVYYIGVFNMDYFLHDALSYRLQVAPTLPDPTLFWQVGHGAKW